MAVKSTGVGNAQILSSSRNLQKKPSWCAAVTYAGHVLTLYAGSHAMPAAPRTARSTRGPVRHGRGRAA
eukprot:10713881-Lingulodinium_polyedra.AAC.1